MILFVEEREAVVPAGTLDLVAPTAPAALVPPAPAPLLLRDGVLSCPNCQRTAPLYEWHPLGRKAEYRNQLAAVYRCTTCRHVFAPLPAAYG